MLLLISLQTESIIICFPVFAAVWQRQSGPFVSIYMEYGSVNVCDIMDDRLHLRNSLEQQ